MGNPTGALIVMLLGTAALVAGIVLGILLYRLDRRDVAGRGDELAHRRGGAAAARLQRDRRSRAA